MITIVSNTETAMVNEPSEFGEWILHEGSGRREFFETVSFGEEFVAPPRVFIALTRFDIRGNSRAIHVRARNITRTEFRLQYSTWDVASVRRVSVQWIAYGRSRSSLTALEEKLLNIILGLERLLFGDGSTNLDR